VPCFWAPRAAACCLPLTLLRAGPRPWCVYMHHVQLIGTAALLALAREGSDLVTAGGGTVGGGDGDGASFTELSLGVKAQRWGRPRTNPAVRKASLCDWDSRLCPRAVWPYPPPRRRVGRRCLCGRLACCEQLSGTQGGAPAPAAAARRYFVHMDVAAACYSWADGYDVRAQQRRRATERLSEAQVACGPRDQAAEAVTVAAQTASSRVRDDILMPPTFEPLDGGGGGGGASTDAWIAEWPRSSSDEDPSSVDTVDFFSDGASFDSFSLPAHGLQPDDEALLDIDTYWMGSSDPPAEQSTIQDEGFSTVKSRGVPATSEYGAGVAAGTFEDFGDGTGGWWPEQKDFGGDRCRHPNSQPLLGQPFLPSPPPGSTALVVKPSLLDARGSVQHDTTPGGSKRKKPEASSDEGCVGPAKMGKAAAVTLTLATVAVCALLGVGSQWWQGSSSAPPAQPPAHDDDGWVCNRESGGSAAPVGGAANRSMLGHDSCASLRANSTESVYPCAFTCPTGHIGVGRTCRCDGCFKGGGCDTWQLAGFSQAGGGGCRAGAEGEGNASGFSPTRWPLWRQQPWEINKLAGEAATSAAMWFDKRYERLWLNLFPPLAPCPTANGSTDYTNQPVIGSCPLYPAYGPVDGIWHTQDRAGTRQRIGYDGWVKRAAAPRTLAPSARNNALSFSGGHQLFIFGGIGCTTTGSRISGMEQYNDTNPVADVPLLDPYSWCTDGAVFGFQNDLWHFNTSDGAGWSLIGDAAHSTTSNPWPRGRVGRSSWTVGCNIDADPDCTHGELWMFGGQDYKDLGPISALWQYAYDHPTAIGRWTLVSGSAYDAVSYALMDKFEEGDIDNLNSKLVAVDPCVDTWPLRFPNPNTTDGGKWDWVDFDEGRCPAARYAAASWSQPTKRGGSAGSWLYGGLTAWPRYLQKLVLAKSVDGKSIDKSWKELTETVHTLNDLWHFNGDAARPIWRRVSGPAGPWPPAAVGSSWGGVDDQLWLWVTLVGNAISRDPAYPKGAPGPTVPGSGWANEMWVFSIDTQVWEQFDRSGIVTKRSSRVSANGAAALGSGDGSTPLEVALWPAKRQGVRCG
jgi:hypothetical protein